ncbi:MAG: glycosyltransferase, partial [Candidatus Thermoplasmatota archaeon]|nr:glycosyltransferase [Candidatus Thermoplasmatota archaeon]
IYTTNLDLAKVEKMGFEGLRIHSIGRVPRNAPLRQQMTLQRFRKLDLGDRYVNYIIAGDWAMSGAVNNKPNIWYVHSPIREIWDLYKFTRENSVPGPFRPIFDIWVRYNRRLNMRNLGHVDKIAFNSLNTQKRVRKYLGRRGTVIYPPIATGDFHYRGNDDFWLSVNRLIHHKRVDIQIGAFEKLPGERLIIVGCFEGSRHFRQYAKYIESIKPPNVQIVDQMDREGMIDLYSRCKGFITTSKDEDFGITPVEAMASGKPVIAPREGGYRETVVDGVTGMLIDDIDTQKLIDAIKVIGAGPESYREECIKRARLFDQSVFIRKIKEQLKELEDTQQNRPDGHVG